MSNNHFHTELQQYFCLLIGNNKPVDDAAWDALVEEVDSAYYAFLQERDNYGVRFSKVLRETDAIDMVYEGEIEDLAADVEQKIQQLVMGGYPIETIESWLLKAVKLSHLKVTADWRILLMDYGREVKMRQLPKALFLWFLKHPEGSSLKMLQEHRDEILDIYRKLTISDDQAQVEASINALVDPLANSFSEKCAAIKLAFLKEIPERVAKNYYIQGPQGGVKSIGLDRALVDWEE